MPTQSFRLTIKSADGLSNTLVITSIRGGTNPYIAGVPSGDGQEVDLLTGAVRTGAYVVEVVDVITGSSPTGTLRLVTSQLYDGTEEYLLLENGDKILLENGDPIELELNNAEYGRVHLLSRKAFLEVSSDGGSTWTTWQAGFLSNVTQIDAIRYAFTISNTRRVEQTQRVFTWSSAAEQTAFPQRGCIVGGPVIGGFGAKPDGSSIALDTKGWEFSFLGSVNAGWSIFVKPGYYFALEFIAGSVAPSYSRTTVFSKEEGDVFYAALNPFVQYDSGINPFDLTFTSNIWNGLKNRNKVLAYPNLVAIITDANGTEWRGTIASLFSPAETGSWYIPELSNTEGGNRLFVRLFDSLTDSLGNPIAALPAINSTTRVRIVSAETTPESPLYFDLHPVDVVTKLYDVANISYKSDTSPTPAVGSAQWMKQRLGPTLRIAARITEPQIMAEFLERSIFGPFGFACRTNGSGEQEFFITRELGGTISYTITDADIQGDAPPSIWSLDEGTAVTGFLIKQKQLTQWVQPQNTKEIGPPDNLVETAQPIQYLNGDTTTFSTRIVEYDIPGMVHDASSFTPSIEPLGTAIAIEGFERFGRGAPVSEVPIVGTSAAAAAQVGDLVYLNATYYPNKNYRIGESNVGPRVVQIVRRDERPEGPIFKLVDAGLTNQPAIAPTITIAASTTDPRRVAEFTITNGAALSNTNEIIAVVEWATGATEPTESGSTFNRYNKGAIPAGPVQLPAVIPGTKVWVRARTEQEGLFPSLWTAWASVTLGAWNAPSSITVSQVTSGKARVTWSLGGNTTDNIDVFIISGTVAPADWSGYRLTTLTSGSTSYTAVNLTASTSYLIGLAFVDTLSGARGTVATQTITTNTTPLAVASRPAGLAIIDGIEDEGLWATGIQLALFPAAGETNIIIQRAPNVIVGGVDTPGTYEEVFAVPSTQRSWTNYLPTNGTRYWYRILHRTPGKIDSSPTAGVSAIATAIPYEVFVQNALDPIVYVATSEAGNTATVSISVIDPQIRLQQVRFRDRTNNGSWSAWTVDAIPPYTYNATIPTTGFVEIEYEVTGFAADGVSRVLASGIEAFDADTNATIVSASGTFSLAGALTLAVQGDTDTNSFKYAFATINWADDAAAYTAAQAGTLVNARNSTITLAGPYAVGSTVYVAIAGYTGASGSGTVSGPYRYAFINGSQDTLYAQCLATQTSATATSVTVQVTGTAPNGTPTVKLKALAGGATITSGAAVGVSVASPASWTFARQAQNSTFTIGPSQAEFEATIAGAISDVDFFEIAEQGRDTVPLVTRARVIAPTTATSVIVRVAVADPYPQGTDSATIAFSTTGLGTITQTDGSALPSPIRVTPVATLTEAAGTYYDFKVPRPSAGSGLGRITFTATATGRVEDSDAVDITPSILVYSLCEATQTNANDTTIEVTVTASADNGTPEVRYTGLTGPTSGGASKFSGPNLNVLSPSGSVWVFTRGSFEAGPSQASFESVLAGAVTDIDFITIPEQQRDTVPLLSRARVLGPPTATYIDVRYAVACAVAPSSNSATITIEKEGIGTITQTDNSALPGTITVTPATSNGFSTPETAGSYYDFRIPRPAANAVPGRVTFTAASTGRVSDSDATDIVPQNPAPASLTVNYTASDTEYVITWSVGSGDTATLSIDGGAFSTPPASPITVARAPYKTGADIVYTFKSVGPMSDVLTSSVTVAKQLPFVGNPATVTVTDATVDSATAVTVSWTFADIPAGSTWTVSCKALDVGSGTITNTGIALGTSPKTRQLTGFSGLGAGTILRATVTAKDGSGNVIASDTWITPPI